MNPNKDDAPQQSSKLFTTIRYSLYDRFQAATTPQALKFRSYLGIVPLISFISPRVISQAFTSQLQTREQLINDDKETQ